MKEIITSCTLDCPDTCSIVARKKGDRVVRLKGNPGFQITRGFLCRKSHGFLPRVFSGERILHPLRKVGSGWKRISWDEAAGIVAGKVDAALAEHGPLSVFYYKDAGSISALKQVNERFFNLLGGATFASGSLCGGAGIAGQTADFGLRTSHAPMDLLNSRLVVIWGRNPAWTNVHLVPILREARRRGTRLVLVDPLRTATAALVDKHVSPIPGSDGYLALGMAKCLIAEDLLDGGFLSHHTAGFEDFLALAGRHTLKQISEISGITANEIKELAVEYGSARPAAILGGWGVQRRQSGANTYRLLDAMGALTGNIGAPGGGVSHGMDETRWYDGGVQGRDRAGQRREIPRPRTGWGLLEAEAPPVKVAFVTGSNPVNQCPNSNVVGEAFGRIDFLVVMDMFMTDTAALADLVLPSTHFLQERDIVASYWHNYVMPVRTAQPRLGEEKSDLEAFALLGQALGLGKDLRDDPDHYLEAMLKPLAPEGISLERVMKGPVRPKAATDVPFADRKFHTESGRFEFVTAIASGASRDRSKYPFDLITPHPHGRNHSQLPGRRDRELPVVHIAPVTARQIGVRGGSRARLETRNGSLTCRVAIVESQRSDTVVVYEGGWESLGGSVNRLTGHELSDMGESATYYDVRCRIEKE